MRVDQWTYSAIAHPFNGIKLASVTVTGHAELHIRTEDLSTWTGMNGSYPTGTDHKQVAPIRMGDHSVFLSYAVLVQMIAGLNVSGNAFGFGGIKDVTIRTGLYYHLSGLAVDKQVTL